MTPATGRTYADAIALLDSLQSNNAIVSSISGAPRDMNLDAIPEMLDWTRKAGYDVSDFAKRGLKCIHVAGTKGKGSVCVMVENILLQYRRSDTDGLGSIGEDGDLGKIGLYTSPHLITVRERIRIDGAPISESMFTRYFFELWDRFSTATTSNLSDPNPSSLDVRPGYFRYLTLLALHTFMEERVETAIVECGIGGEYDSTNILPAEAVTVSAITKLGIDHVGMLGNAIENIAWHKGGILKKGIPAYTVEQVPEAQTVLENCAISKGAELTVVGRLPILRDREVRLGLGGDFQKDNATLAIAVATSHLRNMGITEGAPPLKELSTSQEKLSPQFLKGLETASWPGRWEVRKEGNIEWLIDGAHTIDSIEATAHWYVEKLEDAMNEEVTPTATMLIFNQKDRDAKSLIRRLLTVLGSKSPAIEFAPSRLQRMRFSTNHKMFTYAAFCTNIPFKHQVPEGLGLLPQQEIAKVYEGLAGNTLHLCFGSVEEAVELARRVSEGDERVLVLVTGSLHLVGGLLTVLERNAQALIGSANPEKYFPVRPLPGLEHTLEEEEPIPLQIQTSQGVEPPTEKIFDGRSPEKRPKAKRKIIETFFSDTGYESQDGPISGVIVEQPAAVSDRGVRYDHAQAQPFQKFLSTSTTTRKTLDNGTSQERMSNARRGIRKAILSDAKDKSRDSPRSGDIVEPLAAVSDPRGQHAKSRPKP